jgi:plasmid stability protein
VSLTAALSSATESGRISALAAGGQRDLTDRAAAHPALFPAQPFDGTLFGAVALANANAAPWCTREQLTVANRSALWMCAADWQIDYLSRSADEADAIVARCLAVADGREPAADDALGWFLAEIRDRLGPGLATHGRAWRAELRLVLAAMARERRWAIDHAAGAPPPSIGHYLDNADSFASSFVNVSHWIALDDPRTLAHLPDLTVAGRIGQRILRLVNDLATYDRDLASGDMNVLRLGVDEADVRRRIADDVEECLRRLEPLAARCPREAEYLARQVGFSSGFYQVGDFWGRQ